MTLRYLLCALFVPGVVSAATSAGSDTLTILHFNDSHSILAPLGPRTASLKGTQGGIARLASLIHRERSADPAAILLHAGDFSIGDLSYIRYSGIPELRLLSSLGVTAMAVGNHEFDLGPSALRMTLDTAFAASPAFPLLSANLVLPDRSAGGLATFIHPWTVRQVGAVKVGLFGLTTPSTNLVSRPSPSFLDTNIIPIARAMVDTLRAQGCPVILCVSHLGLWLDSLVAQAVPGITAMVGGHDHSMLSSPHGVTNRSGDTTWIVQTSGFMLSVGRLRLSLHDGKTSLLSYAILPLDASVPEEAPVAAIVDQLSAGIEATFGPMYSARVATVPSFLRETADALMVSGDKDTPIGNLVSDVFRRLTGTDIAIETSGSTAMPFYPGPIVAADIFRVVGYGMNPDNGLGYRLATFTMRGEDLWKGLEFGLSDIEHGDDYFIQVSGMKYTYNSAKPPFQRVQGVTIGHRRLNPLATYTVTANEFVPEFLTTIGISFGNLHVFKDTTEFQALTAALRGMGIVRAKAEGRIRNSVKKRIPRGWGKLQGVSPAIQGPGTPSAGAHRTSGTLSDWGASVERSGFRRIVGTRFTLSLNE